MNKYEYNHKIEYLGDEYKGPFQDGKRETTVLKFNKTRGQAETKKEISVGGNGKI